MLNSSLLIPDQSSFILLYLPISELRRQQYCFNKEYGFVFFVLADNDSSTDAEVSKLIHIKQAGVLWNILFTSGYVVII